MNKYEMLYILSSAATEEEREAVILKLENTVKNGGGTVEKTDKWGMKKLAYPIQFRNDGYYVLMTFESDSELPKELERIAGITDEVIRRMITRL